MKLHAPDPSRFLVMAKTLIDAGADSDGHARMAPSASGRWLSCPGSLHPAAPSPSSDAAREGTACHLLLSYVLSCAAHQITRQTVEIIEVDGHTYLVDESMRRAVRHMIQLVQEPGWDHGWSEVPVEIAKDCKGTADLVLWNPMKKILKVVDLKYGRVPVDVKDNTQLILYAMGALWSLKIKDAQTVILGICQPRAAGDLPAIREWTMDAEEWQDVRKRTALNIRWVRDNPDVLRAGDWCLYCPHKLSCAALNTRLQDLPTPTGELNEIAALIPSVKAWLSAATDYVRNQLEAGAGQADTPLKLVRGAGRRSWALTESETCDALEDLNVDLQKAYALKTVPQVEKLVPRGKRDIFNQLVARGEGGLLLVAASDPRPAVRPGSEFQIGPTPEIPT